ncbi:MAG: hypothetical protein V2J25_13100, partial [Desulfatiglans sp.]|nr:hypothetical protein [Desulfatiglans sp.]
LVLYWIGTSIAISITASSGRLLIQGALKLYTFGPDGIERIRKIILAISGVVSALLVLWASFG